MEDLQWWPALIGGFVGGLAMTTMMTMARKAGATRMDMELLEGSFFTDDPNKARVIGHFMHLVVMSALVFGTIFGFLFAALNVQPSDAWWWGGIFGLVHGVIAGMGMAMMPIVHPRMGARAVAATEAVYLDPPGPFAKNYGALTPAGELVSHLLFGIVLGLVYWWLAA